MSVVPRHSSSVILVRPAEIAAATEDRTDYEVFMVRRPAASVVAPDVYVFPGGTVRLDDRPPTDHPPTELQPAAAHARLGGASKAGMADPLDSYALWLTALRELFEEAGILLGRDAQGAPVAFGDADTVARFAVYRAAVQGGNLSMWELAAREGLRLAPEDLRYWAHWITPEAARARYDTRFFLARTPDGQEALHCGALAELPEAMRCGGFETTDGLWIDPRVALTQHSAGQFPLVFATLAHLDRLSGFRSLEALWACAATKPVVTVLPRMELDVTPPRIVIPPEVRECW